MSVNTRQFFLLHFALFSVRQLFPRRFVFGLKHSIDRNGSGIRSSGLWILQVPAARMTLPSQQRSSFREAQFCGDGWYTLWPHQMLTWWQTHSTEPQDFGHWSPLWLQQPSWERVLLLSHKNNYTMCQKLPAINCQNYFYLFALFWNCCSLQEFIKVLLINPDLSKYNCFWYKISSHNDSINKKS